MVKKICWWLLVIGGINWGLVGLGGFFSGDWNVVHMLLDSISWLESLVYVLVGVSAVWMIFDCKNCCKAPAVATAPTAPDAQAAPTQM